MAAVVAVGKIWVDWLSARKRELCSRTQKKNGQPVAARLAKICYAKVTIRGLPVVGGIGVLLWPGISQRVLRRFPMSDCERWPFR